MKNEIWIPKDAGKPCFFVSGLCALKKNMNMYIDYYCFFRYTVIEFLDLQVNTSELYTTECLFCGNLLITPIFSLLRILSCSFILAAT